MTDELYLIGDIGGTNARLAVATTDGTGYAQERVLNCADFASSTEALRHYLDASDLPTPTRICLAAAGPVVDGQVIFTNNHWIVSVSELRKEFAIENVQLINDFDAIAYSLPLLGDDDLKSVGLPEPQPLPTSFSLAVVGPGTGLGAAGLLRRFGADVVVSGEASHGGFSPETQVQIEVLEILRERFERVSTERLVSGPGIENLYWALCRLHGEQPASMTAADIFAADAASRAGEAVELFFEVLGQFAGDMALALGAADGVYIGGGIAKRYPGRLINSRFRSGFENKGRHRTLLESIATQLILHEQPGLLGAAHCVTQQGAFT